MSSKTTSKESTSSKRLRHHTDCIDSSSNRKHKDGKRGKSDKFIGTSTDDSTSSKAYKRQRSTDDENNSKSVQALSIEESNKLRAKLGLKPLDVSSVTNSSSSNVVPETPLTIRHDDWGDFYHKPAASLTAKNSQDKLRYKLGVQKEKRQLESKLHKVGLLAEANSGSDAEDNASAWVYKSRQLEQAKKTADKLDELDREFGVSDLIKGERQQKRTSSVHYTASHLKGLHVEHDIDNIVQERDVVLTLKDSNVLQDASDVLVNANLVDDEKYEKNVGYKKSRLVYNPYDNEQVDNYGNVHKKELLSQYDDQIYGEKKSGFTIGVVESSANEIEVKLKSSAYQLGDVDRMVESIKSSELKLSSEYFNEVEMVKFKKPKKKVRKNRRVQLDNDKNKMKSIAYYQADDIESDFSNERDDLLEAALHKTRKLKQRNDVFAQFSNSASSVKVDESDNGSIVLNATAEFCRTLGDIPTYGMSGNRNDDDHNDLLDDNKSMRTSYTPLDESYGETTDWNYVDPNEKRISNDQLDAVQDVQILDEEPDVSKGLGAALQLAMSKGYLDKEQNNRPSNSRLAHLQAQHYAIEDKSHNDDLDKSGKRERYSGPITNFKEKDNYKPNIKLEYIDDDGHVLNPKEAFRYLSHKFHGKGPGKNKIEKRIKKGAQEQLMKKMSSTDTPLGTLNMLQSKQKETQSPFVILSGNKQPQSTVICKARR